MSGPGGSDAPAGSAIRVLVVDDDFMVARVNQGMVERLPGFTVVGQAHSGSEALAAVRSLEPDLVLLDVYLPDMSGLEVLRRLREGRYPGVDALAVTAAQDVDTIRTAMRAGVVHYLIKPFTFDALRDRLERYAQAHRRLSAAAQATVAQSDVDRVFGAVRPGRSTRSELPKGLAAETARLVEQALRQAAGDLSATECATLTGLARVSARRYLEHFVVTGRAEVRLRYGSSGRPERRYSWS
ncbi:response regulator [Actinomadura alba]|uniref:Transcriptional regulatory protein n=1 Tax=Actinomadura alba TaxID=406431 RepID=A0ABR7LZU7_9ACTN|nr:response regulator [Actinomadura alba]MBC6470069.1 response regulator [Actinomadura alba]